MQNSSHRFSRVLWLQMKYTKVFCSQPTFNVNYIEMSYFNSENKRPHDNKSNYKNAVMELPKFYNTWKFII